MKFAICNETYGDWPFEKVCADVAQCGYRGIEIALTALVPDPSGLTEADARDYAKMAHDHGLNVVGLHWLLAEPKGLHLTTPDDETRRRTVDHLAHMARLCASMGGSLLILGSPNQRNVVEGDTYEAAFERATESCRQVADVAASLGVTLALEPLAPQYTNFLTSAAETVRLIEAVAHPGCRLHLDALAMSSEQEAISTLIETHHPHLVHFHANDPNLGGPGSGDLDFTPILGALIEARYDGYVSVEVFDTSLGGPTIARSSLDYLRRIYDRLIAKS